MLNESQLERFCEKMRGEGLPEIAIAAFARALRFVAEGGATTIPEAGIEPVDALPHLDSLERYEAAGREAVARSVVIKLNGGLGTSMGLSKAKSLLDIRDGVTFLDLIARQVLAQREAWGGALCLLLMNSFRTRDDSLAALAQYADLARDLPLDFVQHKVPRVDIEGEAWKPVEWVDDAALEWCPPGHGDLYIALQSSGMLDSLREKGIRYAFVSNADNLGAVLDPRILGYMAENELPFLMEVAERTQADRKGGHLARRDGQLMLREVAQCPKADIDAFQNVSKHRFFNTNNLWVDLDALDAALQASPEGLPLPVISNQKRVSSVDDTSPRCLQLETAMGSAIECFEGAEAIVVPRVRFAPVKTTNDLLLLWSDAYEMTDDARMVPVQAVDRVIDLDSRYFGKIDALAARFPQGAPSLIKCRRLSVVGDHRFGADISVEGEVQLVNESGTPVEVASGSVLDGSPGS